MGGEKWEATVNQCVECSWRDAPSKKTVVLLSGETVCNYCSFWRSECYARHAEAVAVLRLQDRDSRRARLDAFEANARDDAIHRRAELAPLSPDEFAAESRRRVEAAVMALWHARRAAAMAPEA